MTRPGFMHVLDCYPGRCEDCGFHKNIGPYDAKGNESEPTIDDDGAELWLCYRCATYRRDESEGS